jgi:hypothetical protein
VGLYLSMAAFNRAVERHSAQLTGEFVCGNPAIPFLFFGLIGGALGGIVTGCAVATLVTSVARRCGHRVAKNAVTLGDGMIADKLIATESRRKDLRSKMEEVERLIVQANCGGDDELTRKLLDYRAKLEHELELRAGD